MHPPPEPSLDRLLAHRAWIGALARSLATNDHDADDLAQDIYLAALKRTPRKTDPRSWITAVARNLVRSSRRGDRRRAEREEEAARDEALPSAAEIVERASLHRTVVSAVLDLPEPHRSTVLFRFFEGLPPRLIARREGVPVETVRTRLKRAQELLRDTLDGLHDGDRSAWVGLVLLHYSVRGAGSGIGSGVITGGSAVAVKAAAGTAVVAGVLATGWFAGWFDGSLPTPNQNDRREVQAAKETPRTRTVARTNAPPTADVATPAAPASRSETTNASDERTPPPSSHASPGTASTNEAVRVVPADAAVRGRVADRVGRPVVGAAVTALHVYRPGADWRRQGTALRELATVKTDHDGAFSLPRVDPPVLLRVDAAQHARTFAFVSRAGHRDVVVAEPGTLRGTVRREADDTACAGALIAVFERDCQVNVFGFHTDGKAFTFSTTVAYAQAVTDANGEFSVPNAAPGSYRLAVFTRDGPACAPRDLRAHVESGATASVDIRLPTREPTTVAGRVIDDMGDPVDRAVVHVAGDPLRRAGSDATGRFRLPAARGERMTLVVETPRRGSATHPLRAGSDGEARIVVCRPAIVIGTVRGADGAAVAGAVVDCLPGGTRAVTNAEGRFVMRAVPSGEHRFIARLAGVGRGSSDAVSVPAGSRTDGVIIRLAQAGTITGRVIVPSGAGGIDLALRARTGDDANDLLSTAPLRTKTANDGRFRLTGVPPGTYRATAWIAEQYHTFRDPIVVTAGTERAVTLDIANDTAIVTGRVTDTKGRAIFHALVKVIAAGDDAPVAFTHTDERGWFRLIGTPQTFRLRVESQGRHFKRMVTDASPRPDPVAIVLQEKEPIRGTVRIAATGEPAQAFWVRAFPRRNTRAIAPGLARKRSFRSHDGRFALAIRYDPFGPPPLIDGVYDIEAGSGDLVSDVAAGVRFEHGATRRDLLLALRPGGRLTGSVVDADGRPINNARVVVTAAERPTRAYERRTDADGVFRLRPMPPGVYRVRVAAGDREARTNAVLERDTETRVSLRLKHHSDSGAPTAPRVDERK